MMNHVELSWHWNLRRWNGRGWSPTFWRKSAETFYRYSVFITRSFECPCPLTCPRPCLCPCSYLCQLYMSHELQDWKVDILKKFFLLDIGLFRCWIVSIGKDLNVDILSNPISEQETSSLTKFTRYLILKSRISLMSVPTNGAANPGTNRIRNRLVRCRIRIHSAALSQAPYRWATTHQLKRTLALSIL